MYVYKPRNISKRRKKAHLPQRTENNVLCNMFYIILVAAVMQHLCN